MNQEPPNDFVEHADGSIEEPKSLREKMPPMDLDAERSVLSAMLLERSAIDAVVPILDGKEFYSEANGHIFGAILDLADIGTSVDLVTVAGRLREQNRLAKCGGSPYLAEIVDTCPAVAHAEDYAAIVRDKFVKRRVISICRRAAIEGYMDKGPAGEYADRVEQSLYEIARSGRPSSSEYAGPIVRRVFQEIIEAAARGERLTGHPTGLDRLDALVAGLHDGELTIVAARPGMGKTSLVMNIAKNVATDRRTDEAEIPGRGVLIFSLEMTRDQLATRLICAEASVDLGRMRAGFLQDHDWTRLTQAAAAIHKLPILIDDASSPTPLEIRSKGRQFAAELERTGKRLGMIGVDYLQLASAVGSHSSREQEISSISRALKGIAKELNVPLVALSQLNRQVETRGKDKRPQLSDLRESGAIEQDADNIIFVYRDDYYNADSDEKGIAELIVAKQRNGPTDKVKVKWLAHCARFDNLQPGEWDTDAA